MKKAFSWSIKLLLMAFIVACLVFGLVKRDEREDQLQYERGETELRVSNLSGATLTLFLAGKTLSDTSRITAFDGNSIWLPAGNYFLRVKDGTKLSYIPISLTGYHCGPDEDGSFNVTVRPLPKQFPPRLDNTLPDFLYTPGGSSLLGDRLNPREPHYVWLTGFFIAPFEVTNGEFRKFLNAVDGYKDDSNWTDEGKRWRNTNTSHSSALLTPNAPDYPRFGRDDLPITWVTWYEANAYCKWLTRKIGQRKWLYSLPNEAEWEKVARGPDNLDYALSMTVSDQEIPLYNWRKNPDALVTVVGIANTLVEYRPNRFGAYHLSGNVVEWTQSINRPYNRERPFVDDDRNSDEAAGHRVARGGSWYSASIAYLYIPYRDAFQPEHSSQDTGFRIVVKALP
ncbi:MAG: FGE-sulfatase protein [Bacteroidetes bacterium]|nr:FGE-sulfatase protein [Bacteroidota bacterium]